MYDNMELDIMQGLMAMTQSRKAIKMSVEEDVQDRETVDTETMAMQKDEENDRQ